MLGYICKYQYYLTIDIITLSFVLGNKPLSQLAKKAPNFNKKEEIFITLTEYQVAMPRAAWFIKLSSAYTVAVSEAKIKKRQLPDPTTGKQCLKQPFGYRKTFAINWSLKMSFK